MDGVRDAARRPLVRVAFVAALVILLGPLLILPPACVPATAEVNPRGAILLTVTPTAATRGEPFTTTDGWSITIERFVLSASVSALFGLESTEYIFDGARSEDFLVRGVPEDTLAHATIGLSNVRLVLRTAEGTPTGYYASVPDVRVAPELAERFARPADGRGPPRCEASGQTTWVCEHNGPSFYLVAQARKGERIVRFEVGLVDDALTSLASGAVQVSVRANSLATAEISLRGEAFFTNDAGALVFEDLAAADSDGDGVLRFDELVVATDPEYSPPSATEDAGEAPYESMPSDWTTPLHLPEGSMVRTILHRAEGMFPPPPPCFLKKLLPFDSDAGSASCVP